MLVICFFWDFYYGSQGILEGEFVEEGGGRIYKKAPDSSKIG